MQRNRIKRKLIDCAHFVPEDVASGDLSDSADFRISKLRIPNTRLGSPPLPAPSLVSTKSHTLNNLQRQIYSDRAMSQLESVICRHKSRYSAHPLYLE